MVKTTIEYCGNKKARVFKPYEAIVTAIERAQRDHKTDEECIREVLNRYKKLNALKECYEKDDEE